MADEPNPLLPPAAAPASAPVPVPVPVVPVAEPIKLGPALDAVKALDRLLKDPALAQLLPAAEAFAVATRSLHEVQAQVVAARAERDQAKAEADRDRADSATVKQRAIDDIRRREADHVALCQGMTVDAQHEVEALELRKSQVLAETDEAKAQTEAHLASLQVDISEKTTELTAIETRLGNAKRKLAELLSEAPAEAPPVAEASSASTTGDNVVDSTTTTSQGGN